LVIGLTVAASLILVSAGSASAEGLVYACLSQNGDVKQMSVDSVPVCKSKETLVQWNQVGPAGEKGDPGDDGVSSAIFKEAIHGNAGEIGIPADPSGVVATKLALDAGAYFLVAKTVIRGVESQRHIIECDLAAANSISSGFDGQINSIDNAIISIEPVAPGTATVVPVTLIAVAESATAFEAALTCWDPTFPFRTGVIGVRESSIVALRVNQATFVP
jgi:hypothetical protein